MVSGAAILAFALVAAIWATGHWSTVARMRRASERVVEMARKSQDESPMALGLAANRFGKELADDAVLELEPHGDVARGKQEIVQLFAQVRAQFARIGFDNPIYVVQETRRGEVAVTIDARFRFESGSGGGESGNGRADLVWRKGEKGWRIERATLREESGRGLPEGLP